MVKPKFSSLSEFQEIETLLSQCVNDYVHEQDHLGNQEYKQLRIHLAQSSLAVVQHIRENSELPEDNYDQEDKKEDKVELEPISEELKAEVEALEKQLDELTRQVCVKRAMLPADIDNALKAHLEKTRPEMTDLPEAKDASIEVTESEPARAHVTEMVTKFKDAVSALAEVKESLPASVRKTATLREMIAKYRGQPASSLEKTLAAQNQAPLKVFGAGPDGGVKAAKALQASNVAGKVTGHRVVTAFRKSAAPY